MVGAVILIILVLIAGLLVFGATKPNSFRLERSTVIKAAPEKVFGYLTDFHQWGVWSPWEKIDPTMTRAYEGPDSGKGAVYRWEGNGKAGAGRMEITDSRPGSEILIRLDFYKPMKNTNTTEFTLTPEADGTRVNWAMFGPSSYMSKLMTIFFNMEKLVGPDFEKGLASLKAAAEA